METSRNLAVLFSVPESFLLSGLECIAAQHQQDVYPAFLIYGTMEFEAFAAVEKARNGKALEMFIYAADAAGDRPLNPEVTWKGIYLGVEAATGGGRYRGKPIHRPAITLGDRKPSALFWKVSDLKKQVAGMPIGRMQALTKKTLLPDRYLPEKPTLIEYPFHQTKWFKPTTPSNAE
jgi:hypothetical protein